MFTPAVCFIRSNSTVEPTMDTSPKTILPIEENSRLVSPRQEARSPPSSILSININNLDENDLENIDVDTLVNIKGLDTTASLKDLPLDSVKDIDIGLEDFSSINSKDICAICHQHKPNEVDQLIKCTRCGNKYHTTCLKLPPIPYSVLIPIEKRKHDNYVRDNYGKWMCSNCKKKESATSGMQSPSIQSPAASPKKPHIGISPIPFFKPSGKITTPLSPSSPKHTAASTTLMPSPSSQLSPSPLSSPRPVQPVIKKAAGADLSNGGVIVGTQDYLWLQKQIKIGKVTEIPSVPIPKLETQLVPIYTDSETSSEDEAASTPASTSTQAPAPAQAQAPAPTSASKQEKKKHIKTKKLKSFLQSLLVMPNDDTNFDDFIGKVTDLVKQNSHPSDLDLVYAVPVFLLRSMLQTAAISPSSIPMSGISKIDGKEVTRIADHPKLKPYFDRLQNSEKAEDIKKDMIAAGIDDSLLEKDPNTVVLLDNYNVSYVQFEKTSVSKPQADEVSTSVIRLKATDHPLFRKYFNMLKRNIPRADVEKDMVSCGLDPSVLNKPNELVEYVPPPPPPSLPESTEKMISKPEIAPTESAEPAMRDKVDSSILDKDPNEEIEIEVEEEGATTTAAVATKKKVKLCEHPVYSKYFNMLKKGVPEVAVRHSMMRDKVDSSRS